MPLPTGFKTKKEYAAYMRQYRKFNKQKKTRLQKAILDGDLVLAKQILNTKPSINIKGKKC